MENQIKPKTTKTNRQVIIDFIISCLKKGEQRGEILVKTGKKWGTSKSAFDRMLKIAKEQHAIRQEEIKKELEEVDRLAAIEARKKAILSADERKELLTKIAKGEIEIPDDDVKWNPNIKIYETHVIIRLANHVSRINAIAELNKMDGEYAPRKTEITGPNGQPIQTQTVTKSDEELQKRLAELERIIK